MSKSTKITLHAQERCEPAVRFTDAIDKWSNAIFNNFQSKFEHSEAWSAIYVLYRDPRLDESHDVDDDDDGDDDNRSTIEKNS